MKKVAIIGAGNVGGTTAMRIAEGNLANVVLIDVAPNLARAKACDLEDARYSLDGGSPIEASADLSQIRNSDIVVVTAGLPRKPGMTREDLLLKNSAILSQVCQGILEFAQDAVVIIVTNPLDVMTYYAAQKTGLPRNRIFGMGGGLDSARFANLIAKKLFVGIEHVRAVVLGSHGETMLPLPRLTTVRGRPLTELLDEKETEALVQATRQRGAEIVSLYASGSAYYGPSAAIYDIVRTILQGRLKEIAVSAVLEGEYGFAGVSIGVLAKIGASGIKEINLIDLTKEEKEAFGQSVKAIKDSIAVLNL